VLVEHGHRGLRDVAGGRVVVTCEREEIGEWEPRLEEAQARGDDLDVGVRVAGHTVVQPGDEQALALDRLDERERHAGARGEFGEIEVSSGPPAAVAMAEVETEDGPVQLELAAAVPSEAASPDSLPDSVPVAAVSDEPQAA
jgi:hypothetical protein